MQEYLIHANYCQPYKVVINSDTNHVSVYELDDKICLDIISIHGIDDYTEGNTYSKEICSFGPEKIFLGKS